MGAKQLAGFGRTLGLRPVELTPVPLARDACVWAWLRLEHAIAHGLNKSSNNTYAKIGIRRGSLNEI